MPQSRQVEQDQAADTASRTRVGEYETLRKKGVIVVAGEGRRIAVFADGDGVFAVENNCPHMGFPLDRGTVRDGILTCHWHQARFDLRSGCTFDLWADDVARYETTIEDGIVYVSKTPTVRLDAALHRKRLRRSIEQNVGLVQAKSLLALLEGGADLKSIVAEATNFACRNLTAWAEGMTRLGCIVNLFPYLSRDTAYQGLYYAVRRIAEEASEAVSRRERLPLDDGDHDLSTLRPWLQQWVQTRHRDGAERTILTGIGTLDDAALAELVFCAASERLYANGGHLFEDCNKAFEYLGLLGKEAAMDLFPLFVPGLASARGQEESTNWHHPVEIVAPIRAVDAELPGLLAPQREQAWHADHTLNNTLIGDDPIAIIEALKSALGDGAPPDLLARQVAYVAAMRLARFGTSNEVTDWFNPQHTFIYANGVYQAVRRSPAPLVVRSIFHGAISVYMDRFLNVPPAKLPGERNQLDSLPEDGDGLTDLLLRELDQHGNIDNAADIVARYLRRELPFDALVDTLTFATVREDLDFHSLQVLEAGVNQCRAWNTNDAIETILVGVVRNLAAHCPTRRAGHQTAMIARRLHRGERVYEG